MALTMVGALIKTPVMTYTQSLTRKLAAWGVHLFTASTAVMGVYTLKAIYNHQPIIAFWWMSAAIFVDAIDGTLARSLKVTTYAAKIDGVLLDNMVDYLNYVITPAFFLLINKSLLPPAFAELVIVIMVLTSAYQFTQNDAKTPDHFFKGFPCYWNIVVFYLFLFQMQPSTNAWIISFLSLMIFVPIKYVYPSRMDYLSRRHAVRAAMLIASIVYGIAGLGILWTYPKIQHSLMAYSMAYVVFYFVASFYRTLYPLATHSDNA